MMPRMARVPGIRRMAVSTAVVLIVGTVGSAALAVTAATGDADPVLTNLPPAEPVAPVELDAGPPAIVDAARLTPPAPEGEEREVMVEDEPVVVDDLPAATDPPVADPEPVVDDPPAGEIIEADGCVVAFDGEALTVGLDGEQVTVSLEPPINHGRVVSALARSVPAACHGAAVSAVAGSSWGKDPIIDPGEDATVDGPPIEPGPVVVEPPVAPASETIDAPAPTGRNGKGHGPDKPGRGIGRR